MYFLYLIWKNLREFGGLNIWDPQLQKKEERFTDLFKVSFQCNVAINHNSNYKYLFCLVYVPAITKTFFFFFF